jgi:hypothetical protein
MAALPLRAQTARERNAAEQGPQIQDNSFLLEESYNQEPGVVQHIFTYLRDGKSKQWVGTFTQEWPVGGIKHQFSYQLVANNGGGGNESSGPGGNTGGGGGKGRSGGIGDAKLNYRYQLLGSGETPLAIAPRLSAVLPTGDYKTGRGEGSAGVEVWLPVSWVLDERLVTHYNAGLTYTPRARDAVGERAATRDYTLGASAIWLAHPRLNFMVETQWQSQEEVTGPDRQSRSTTVLVSPGARFAFNFPASAGLQIVSGVAVPITVKPSGGGRSVFLYLSFEHAFRRGVKGPGEG